MVLLLSRSRFAIVILMLLNGISTNVAPAETGPLGAISAARGTPLDKAFSTSLPMIRPPGPVPTMVYK